MLWSTLNSANYWCNFEWKLLTSGGKNSITVKILSGGLDSHSSVVYQELLLFSLFSPPSLLALFSILPPLLPLSFLASHSNKLSSSNHKPFSLQSTIMSTVTKLPIVVLREFRPFCKALAYFNIDNFSGHNRHVIVHNLYRASSVLTLYLGQIFTFSVNMYYANTTNLPLDQRLYQVTAASLMIQHLAMAISLSLKSRRIDETFDRLEELMKHRKLTTLCLTSSPAYLGVILMDLVFHFSL